MRQNGGGEKKNFGMNLALQWSSFACLVEVKHNQLQCYKPPCNVLNGAITQQLCCFQTSLQLATLMVIFVQLCKHHLPQRENQAVSSVKPINR